MKKIETYKFDGEWEFEIELETLNQFSWERDGSGIKIIIHDFPAEDLEPYNEQIECINFIIQDQHLIKQAIVESIWENWDEIKEIHELDEWDEFPSIESMNDLLKVVRVDEIYIKPLHKDKISYFGVLCDCMWDEEHGLGIVLHRNRVIGFGGAEEADAGGSETTDIPDNSETKGPDTPILFQPHPKFKTYKPSHLEANIDYPHKLIEQALNQEFVNYFLANPDPDFIHPEDWQKRTYMQTACMYNNEQIFNILLPVAQNLSKSIYNSHKRKNISFIERLLEKGADIHETHFGTSILTEAVEQHLRLISVNLTDEQMDKNHQTMIEFYNKPQVNKFSPVVEEMKMHPKKTIERSRKYISKLMEYEVSLDDHKINYVKQGNRNNPEALKAIDKEVEWIKEKL